MSAPPSSTASVPSYTLPQPPASSAGSTPSAPIPRPAGIAASIGFSGAVPSGGVAAGTSGGTVAGALGGGTAGSPPSQGGAGLLTPDVSAIVHDDITNPFKVETKEYEEYNQYYKPLSIAQSYTILNTRDTLGKLADLLTEEISPLAKLLLIQQIVELCISLTYPLYVRAEVFSIVSTGFFSTPSEIKASYYLSKMYSHEKKLVAYLNDMQSKRFVQKGPRHKTTFKSLKSKPLKSCLSPSSKTHINQTVTFLDSTLNPAQTTLASSSRLSKSLEDIYKEMHMQPQTVYNIMDVLADFDLSSILKEDLDELTLKGGLSESLKSSQKGSGKPFRFKAKPPKEYPPTLKGMMDKSKDAYEMQGITVKNRISPLTDQAVLIVQGDDTRRLAVAAAATESSARTSWDTVVVGRRKNKRSRQASNPFRSIPSRRTRKRLRYADDDDDGDGDDDDDDEGGTSGSEYLMASTSGTPQLAQGVSSTLSKLHSSTLRGHPKFRTTV